MGIKDNKKKITIEFEWTEDRDSTDPIYSIKHHYTDKYGATISVKVSDEGIYYDFPAQMFLEVVEFLGKEGVFKIDNINVAPTEKKDENILSAPIIDSDDIIGENEHCPISLPVDEDSPAMSFSAKAEKETVEEEQITLNTGHEEMSEEESAAILAERAAASGKANTEKKNFKRTPE